MKKISLLVCVGVLLLPCAVSAFGNISVSSSPVGASIYVDDVLKGTTVAPSFTVIEVVAGTRGVVLQLSGYQNFTTNTDIPDGGTSIISATLTPNTPSPTITSSTPPNGYNTSTVSITYLAGSGFATTGGIPAVVLMKTGQTNITATSVSVVSSSQITCTFDITNKQAGYWNIIVTNPDGQYGTLTNGFEVKNPSAAVTLSSITPSSAVANTTASISSLAGTGFVASPLPQILLRRSLYNDLTGTVTSATTTNIIGTFNLTNRVPGSYSVCVINSGADAVCGLTFTITAMGSTTNGTIDVKSTPTSSKVFLNSVYKGYSPMTLDVTPGTYTVLVQRAGYNEYSENIAVTAGNISYVTASLVLTPDETTATTTAPQTTATTVKTTAKSTAKVPTPWPSATATPASPVSTLSILGAVGVGLIVLRKW